MAHVAEKTFPSDNVASLTRRRHWTVRDGKATFAPVDGGWRGTVTKLSEPTGSGRFHVAIVDRNGVTRFVSEAAELPEAVDRAERGATARNALRLVPPGPRPVRAPAER